MSSNHLVYHPYYNIKFLGLEKLHPFDSCKYEKIIAYLKTRGIEYVVPDREITEEELLRVHSKEYLERLKSSSYIASICEMFLLNMVPNSWLQRYILSPMRWQVAGTILASQIAMKRGWSINIGGGMHHASWDDGGGWCVYSDIPLALNILFEEEKIGSIMIIDLDVHQGNGIERDIQLGIIPPKQVIMVDCFNPKIYPKDRQAKKAIDIELHVTATTTDRAYLQNLEKAMNKAIAKLVPDFVVYNAGTDILEGDPLNGSVKISPQGIIDRDIMVMEFFVKRKIPIMMVLSGGYSPQSADIIGKSIENICQRL